jgi:endonuclease/exonuclease/phosphatase (EEP) superfamily protein YafD
MSKVGIAWIVLVLVLLGVHVLVPQRSGFLALTAVLEPYVVVTALIAAPFALIDRNRAGSVVVAVLVVIVLGRYVPGCTSLPASGVPRLTVATWNIFAGPNDHKRALAGVLAADTADLIALVELRPGAANALAAEPELLARLPYRFLASQPGVPGTGLMSRFPIQGDWVSTDPPFLRAEVALPDQTLVVYVVHPLSAGISSLSRIPTSLETGVRDAALRTIRAFIDTDIAAGRSIIVAGDINTTEREPAYVDFSRGLRDAHLDAGIGPGLTWRPGQLNALPFGVVRIDYLFTTPDLQALSTHVVCNELSDHCLLSAEFK